MKVSLEEIRMRLAEKGLKVTPQRVAILDAIYTIESHPTADAIIDHIRQSHPNIASGTVYRVLDTLIENHLVKKVTTDEGVMRYDGIMEGHHHLYCSECDQIEDYVDEKLTVMLKEYFRHKRIKGFHPQEFSLQIKGTFDKC